MVNLNCGMHSQARNNFATEKSIPTKCHCRELPKCRYRKDREQNNTTTNSRKQKQKIKLEHLKSAIQLKYTINLLLTT